MKIISAEKKLWWDIIVFGAIIISAFEIPYSLIIGWKNPQTTLFFDIFLYSVFIADIYINFHTKLNKRYSGFLDWRDFMGFVSYGLSEEDYRTIHKLPSYEVKKRREIAKEYISSKWFFIDVLSIVPFDIIFGTFGFLNASRILRLSRLPRMLHLIKSLRMGKIQNNNPALIRFFYIFIFAPFLMNLYSCLLFLFKADQARNTKNYWQNFHIVYKSMKEGVPFDIPTAWGMGLSYAIAFSGIIFLGIFIGNFAGLFINKDRNAQQLETKLKQYKKLAKKYPLIFDKDLTTKILTEVKEKHLSAHQEKEMIEALSGDLEKAIKDKITQAPADEVPSLANLKKSLFDDQ